VWVSNWSYIITVFSVFIIHCVHTVINVKVSTFDYTEMDCGFKESEGSAGRGLVGECEMQQRSIGT
jgi:hypothetical protein